MSSSSYVDPEGVESTSNALPSVEDMDVNAEELEKNAPRVAKSRNTQLLHRIADAEEKKKE